MDDHAVLMPKDVRYEKQETHHIAFADLSVGISGADIERMRLIDTARYYQTGTDRRAL